VTNASATLPPFGDRGRVGTGVGKLVQQAVRVGGVGAAVGYAGRLPLKPAAPARRRR
jgi:hypothetical protein